MSRNISHTFNSTVVSVLICEDKTVNACGFFGVIRGNGVLL
jgi:hypothetical protein